MAEMYRFKAHKEYAKDVRDAMPSFVALEVKSYLAQSVPDMTGKGVRVCVIGSGHAEHSCLVPTPSLANLSKCKHNRDVEGHSHVIAGIIGASDKNNLVGLAPEVTFSYAKATDDTGATTANCLAASVLWSTVVKSQVVVISNKVDFNDYVLANAIEKASNMGSVVVVSETDGEVPDHVIVAADVKLKEPEGDLWSAYTDNRYVSVSPENFKEALVAGVVALLAEGKIQLSSQKPKVHVIKSLLNKLTEV